MQSAFSEFEVLYLRAYWLERLISLKVVHHGFKGQCPKISESDFFRREVISETELKTPKFSGQIVKFD